MNRQGKNGIEYLDWTWNPVTGCLHGCEYCYARKIAKRFDGRGFITTNIPDDKIVAIDTPIYKRHKNGKDAVAPFPYGFCPTLHRYRLDEPQKVKKPSVIGVVYMGDLFGEWVPDEWMQEVFKACEAAPWHKYLFLTKNPKRYSDVGAIRPIRVPEIIKNNIWLGATVTTQEQFEIVSSAMLDADISIRTFLSIEPLLEKIQLRDIDSIANWVIIGEQTNPSRPPRDEWVQNIIGQCQCAGVPVFVKSPLYSRFPIQEFPKGLEVR